MKKLITIAILSTVLLAVAFSHESLGIFTAVPSVALNIASLGEPVIFQTVVKIDDQTVEITTTTTTETVIQYDRAELQTELDHIPDRKAEIQERLDMVNAREAELIEILKVFD